MSARVEDSPWTDARIEKLRQLWRSGWTAARIARELGGGVTRNAVVGKAHRLGLSGRPSPIRRESAPKEPKAKRAGGYRALVAHTETCAKKRAERYQPAQPKPGDYVPQRRLPALRECAWPEGERLPFTFCGEPTVEGKPYCAGHCARAYQGKVAPDEAA